MFTTLRIGTTDYDHTPTGRPAAGIFDLRLRLTVEQGYGQTLTFSVKRCGADAPFVPGVPVTLTTTTDGLVFSGDLDAPQVASSELGYCWFYTCTDLKYRANRCTLAGLDGSAVARFNLSPDDALALYATSGQTVGQIVAAVLQSPTNAAALNGVGVGAYASMSPPALPSATLADLAALSIVPPEPVLLQGEGTLNTIEQFILHWHQQYALWVEADGTIRVKSINAFTPQTLHVPGDAGSGDDVEWPSYSVSCRDCYTAVSIHGLSVGRAELSVKDGTLAKGWTPTQESAWTIDDFLQPKDSSDDGDLSSVTSSSCTVTSDYATAHWIANFWNGDRGGWIQFIWTAGSGIDVHEERQITSCTALTPGGSATIGWDASLPLASSSYDRYHIRGLNSPMALVDRKFYVAEPGHLIGGKPAQGLDTWVGSHLYPRFPKGTWLSNLSSTQTIFMPAAYERWSSDGNYPWFEVPIKVQINPKDGSIVLTEPAVSKFGSSAGLEAGYPTSFSSGLWSDVRAVVPYVRGDLNARSPASGYSGTAFTKYGIQREKVIRFDALTWAGDVPAMQQLAAELLAVVQDAVVEGTAVHHDMPAGFSAFRMGYSLQFVFPSGITTPIDGMALPVRSATIHWPEDGALRRVEFEFSNLRRPFEGDDRFIHPGFSGETFGTQGGEAWIGGNVGGFSGSTDSSDWNSAMQQAGESTPQETPLSQATASNPLAQQGPNPLADAMGNNPLGQQGNPLADATSGNPLGDAMSGGGGYDGSDLSLDPSQFQGSGTYAGNRGDRVKAAKDGRTTPDPAPPDLGSDITGAMLAKSNKSLSNTRRPVEQSQRDDRSGDLAINNLDDQPAAEPPSIGGLDPIDDAQRGVD